MVRKKGGWYGEPGRHADAARGISTKGVTREERELRMQTREFLAGKESNEQPIVVDVTDELVEDLTEWATDKLGDRLNELGFWNPEGEVAEGDPPQSEKELFDRIAHSDAPDDVYSELQATFFRFNPDLTADQMYRVANDAVTAGVQLVAKAAWRNYLGALEKTTRRWHDYLSKS